MKRQKIWVKTFLSFYFILAIIVLFFLSLVDFNGDLTRLGKLCEYAFGWKKKKPKIDPKLLKSSSLKDSDVIVVGDSFSEKFVWQTKLTEAGYKVKTIHWTDIDDALCSDFGKMLLSNQFKGNLVIIETVQRAADDKISRSLSCSSGKVLLDHEYSQPPPLTRIPKVSFNFKEKIMTGIETLYNTLQAASPLRANSLQIFGPVLLKPLQKGCDWFSNRYCGIGLFLSYDLDSPPINSNTIEKIKKINLSLPQFKVIWLVVPDKSSIYTERKEIEFWKDLEKNNLGPDLLSAFTKERDKIVDLYLPNDTHLSSAGALFMGDKVKHWIETH